VKNAVVTYWLRKIEREEKAHDEWRKEARDASKAYHDEERNGLKNLFPMFWANVNILHAALYSATPKPDVRKRNSAGPQDPVSKAVAQCIERCITFILDTEDFNGAAHRIVDDYLVAALGVPWVEYDAVVNSDDNGPTEIALQRTSMAHVPWERFHWEPSQTWEDCDWIAREHFLTRNEVQQQFNAEPSGEAGTMKPEDKPKADKYESQFKIYEIWYRPKRMVYVIGQDFDKPLEVRADKLRLKDFYPCPKPLFANLKSKELIPKPDYCSYSAQCDEMNILTARITSITRQIKVGGFYDAQMAELAQLSNASDGTLVPIANLAERIGAANGHLDTVIAQLPIDDKVKVVQTLMQMREQTKATAYEINGISDIVRGVSDPNETNGAQQLKGHYANLRTKRRQMDLDRAFRDVFRLFAEIICEHFTPEQIYLMSGTEITPQMQAVMKSDLGRAFAIDVESDSTVAADDQENKQATMDMVSTMSGLLSNVLPAMQQGAMPADVGKELILAAVGSFKSGKNLEDALQALPGTQQQLAQQNQQVQQLQQQLEQCQKQLQDAQQQLGQVDQRDQARKDFEAQSKAQGTQAEAVKDGTTAQLNMARTAEAHAKAAFPFAPLQ